MLCLVCSPVCRYGLHIPLNEVVVMCCQRSGERMSPEKEGLRAVSGEPCRSVGKPEQDADQ